MSAPRKNRRLRPGELDGLVLSYLCKHQKGGPLTATAIAKGLGGRSAGAVSNCLERLVRERKVRRAGTEPRTYAIRGERSR